MIVYFPLRRDCIDAGTVLVDFGLLQPQVEKLLWMITISVREFLFWHSGDEV